MADLSCHLVDRVLADVPYRQWVLSFPHPLRYLLAYDAALLSTALGCFIGAIAHWQRHEAKKRYGLRTVRDAVTAAVTMVQRFGSALELNPHFHSLCPDGVWEKRGETLVFRKLGRPTQQERRDIGWRACQALVAHLRGQGRWVDEEPDLDDDELQNRDPLLAEIYAASIRGRLLFGDERGSRVVVLRRGPDMRTPKDLAPVDVGPRGYNFDVHAGVSVDRGDREALERLCRYLCRPAAAADRFEERKDGTVSVRLKRAWRDGTTHVVLTALQLVERLVALIPAPRVNMIRYPGAWAPNAKLRAEVVPAPEPASSGDETARCTHAGRQSYAFLMKRVFSTEVEVCAKCGGKTRIEFVTARDEIARVLRSIGYPNAPGCDDDAAAA